MYLKSNVHAQEDIKLLYYYILILIFDNYPRGRVLFVRNNFVRINIDSGWTPYCPQCERCAHVFCLIL